MSVWTDNAHQFATRDRDSHVDQNLTAACRTAIEIIRIGRALGEDPERARYDAAAVLKAAGNRAENVIGRRRAS